MREDRKELDGINDAVNQVLIDNVADHCELVPQKIFYWFKNIYGADIHLPRDENTNVKSYGKLIENYTIGFERVNLLI